MPLALPGRTKDAVVVAAADADWRGGVERFLRALGYVRTPLINIPVGTTNAILRMFVYAQTGESPLSPLPSRPIGEKISEPAVDIDSSDGISAVSAYDAQYVMILNGANQILEILQWNRRNELFWMPRQFDLTKWAGQSVSDRSRHLQ